MIECGGLCVNVRCLSHVLWPMCCRQIHNDCLTLIINYAKLAFISLFANSMLQNIYFFYFFALYTCLVFLA